MSEGLWDTPESWVWSTLGFVAEWSSGGTPKSTEPKFYNGDIPWLVIGDLNDGIVTNSTKTITSLGLENSSAKMVKKGAILIAMYGSIGKLGIAGIECSTNQAIAFTDNIPHDVETKYLFYYLLYARTKLNEAGKGGAQQNISQTVLKDFPICIAPRSEQRRIVAKLERLLSRVDAAQTRLATIPRILKRFRQSVLATACSGKLTADWRGSQSTFETASQLIKNVSQLRRQRFIEACKDAKEQKSHKPREYDNYRPVVRADLELFDIPDDWEWVDLRFLMDEQEPFCYGVVQPSLNDPTGVFLVRAGDLKEGSVNLTELRKIPLEVDNEYSRSRLKGGELLVTVVGANIGVVSIAPNECKGFNIARAVAKIPINDFSTRYVYYWLNTSKALSWMVGDAREVARPTLNLEQLRTILVPIPSLAEQDEIVRRVEALFKTADALEARYRTAKAHVDKLTQSILARAFRGELVTTEAELARREGRDYEPASVLLERIRQERAQQATSTKSKPKQRRPARKAASSTKLFT